MELEKKLCELFSGFSKVSGRFSPDGGTKDGTKATGKAVSVRGGATPASWRDHLTRKVGLGIVPLRDDNTVSFAAIDVDRYTLKHDVIEKRIKELKLPLVVFSSKSGGAHLYLFLKEPVPAVDVRAYLETCAAALGYGGSELFPKQVKRNNNNDTGNWINMPYYGGDERCAMIDGSWASVDKFVDYIWERRTEAEELKKPVLSKEEPFPDGPPCLNTLITLGKITEFKNNWLLNFAIFVKQKYPEKWKDMVVEANYKYLDTPGPHDEVTNIIKQVDKGKYAYKCKEEPIASVCNKGKCMNRAFGAKHGTNEVNVILDGLVKYLNPFGGRPIYYININGLHRVMLENCDILFDQKRFTTLVFEETNIVMNRVKDNDWRERMRELSDTIEEIILPMDESPEGLFLIYVSEFIEDNSKNVASMEELKIGRCYIDEQGCANFSRHTLFEFLKHRGFAALSQPKKNEVLKKVGATSEKGHLGGEFRNWVRLPLANLPNHIQEEPLPTPDVKPKF